MRKLLLILIILFPLVSFGQRIDNIASFRNVTGEKYLRIHYDNDFYTKTDYYYTQGYNLEFVNPALKKNPLSQTLLRLKNSRTKYGISFEHYGFTPTSIKSNEILRNDRPFAGVIMLKSFAVSVDTLHKSRLSSILSTGMLGPAAFAGKMQKKIHSWTGDPEPMGWQYQIRNEVVVNYELNYEKEIFNVPDIISLNTNSGIRLGTLSDKIQGGATLTIGRFDSPFQTHEKRIKNNYQLYFYTQPLVSLIGYDASMQGGIINRSSPYTLTAGQINRFTFQNSYGVILSVRNLYVEYYRTYLSKEFETGRTHKWGGLKIGFAF
ncbi:lipid A deacylase LpxR family protein [Dyadobacter frigoris]|uniref:Lipid A deacylase LpxR family protein n=1 Tax=Dyadobacter frigoris TaxID=2576211 RepID=A0A4U6CSR8_9BACT|nr:lipid A deacylase LpxR family protein [Dyadobacter frigoris]TKT86597.1 lipid A deacylase LpxR family protein [Dyadobacter frigoris]GLU56859.1 exonuclease [Dyadobacter frigoris]